MRYSILTTVRHLYVLAGVVGLAASLAAPVYAGAPDTAAILPIEDFIVLAAQNDTVFEEILIEELKLKYEKALNLPAGDIVLSVKSHHNFLLSRDDEKTDLTVGLSKLFPLTGTELAASYGHTPSLTSGRTRSEFHGRISQPIARNAFGRGTRLDDRIIGLEMDLARYQIVEAYEDYLASLMTMYYDWYSAYENLKISESSWLKNQKLLENMLERAEQRIALPVDVNKVRLLVLANEQRWLQAQEAYANLTRLVEKAVRYDDPVVLKPGDPFGYHAVELDFEQDYQAFTESSRTYEILALLERKAAVKAVKDADDLLPSTNVLVGYRVEGDRWRIENEHDLVYAGVSLEWPVFNTEARARHAVSLIDQRRQGLANQNKDVQLYTDLKDIYSQVQREQALITLAEKRIALAEAVLVDETTNYSYGKISLNDYIDAVNRLDEYRFQKTAHAVFLHQLITEWLRLTDRLISSDVLESPVSDPQG